MLNSPHAGGELAIGSGESLREGEIHLWGETEGDSPRWAFVTGLPSKATHLIRKGGRLEAGFGKSVAPWITEPPTLDAGEEKAFEAWEKVVCLKKKRELKAPEGGKREVYHWKLCAKLRALRAIFQEPDWYELSDRWVPRVKTLPSFPHELGETRFPAYSDYAQERAIDILKRTLLYLYEQDPNSAWDKTREAKELWSELDGLKTYAKNTEGSAPSLSHPGDHSGARARMAQLYHATPVQEEPPTHRWLWDFSLFNGDCVGTSDDMPPTWERARLACRQMEHQSRCLKGRPFQRWSMFPPLAPRLWEKYVLDGYRWMVPRKVPLEEVEEPAPEVAVLETEPVSPQEVEEQTPVGPPRPASPSEEVEVPVAEEVGPQTEGEKGGQLGSPEEGTHERGEGAREDPQEELGPGSPEKTGPEGRPEIPSVDPVGGASGGTEGYWETRLREWRATPPQWSAFELTNPVPRRRGRRRPIGGPRGPKVWKPGGGRGWRPRTEPGPQKKEWGFEEAHRSATYRALDPFGTPLRQGTALRQLFDENQQDARRANDREGIHLDQPLPREGVG